MDKNIKKTDIGNNYRIIPAYSNYKNIYQMILAEKRRGKRDERDPNMRLIDDFLFDWRLTNIMVNQYLTHYIVAICIID